MLESYVVLSRKYRPKVLEDLIGQEILAKSLKSCIDNRKVPHAFLFHGMRGVGKTTTARILSRCLSCVGEHGLTNMTSHPCGNCHSCLAIDRDHHMDVMEFDAASRTGVDDIREIIDSSQYAPILGRFKIYIIDEVHMLSKSAFNALLKTLEEPPQHVKFIFATTELYKVPETVLSRCMTFQLKPVSPNSIAKHLQIIAQKEGYSLDQDASEVIAEESEGSVRDALSIVEQSMMIVSNSKTITSDIVFEMLGRSTNREIENLLHLILSSDSRSALKIVEDLTSKGADPFILYKNIQNCLYKMIVESTNSSENQKNCQSIQNLLYLWQILLKQTENMKNAHNPIQVLSAAVVILSLTASFQNIGDLFIKEEESPEKQILNKVESKFEGITISEIE